MSGVQATLALVLLRYMRKGGGKAFRKWFARSALNLARHAQLEKARKHFVALFDDRYRNARGYHWHHWEMTKEAHSVTETAPRYTYTPPGTRMLSRVVYYSHYHGCNQVKWRRVGHPEPDSLYMLLPAPQPKRRSLRLGLKRYRKRIKK